MEKGIGEGGTGGGAESESKISLAQYKIKRQC